MNDLERIFERFDDLNDFAGFGEKREYEAERRELIRERVGKGDLMDLIMEYQFYSVDAAFLDGFRYGMKFLIENIM